MLLHGGLLSKFYFAPEKETGGGELTDEDVLGEDAGKVETTESAPEPEAEADPEVETTEDPDEGVEDPEPQATVPSLSDVYKQHNITGLPEDPQELIGRFQRAQQAEQEAQQMRNALLWQLHNQQQQQAQIQQWQAQQQQEKPKPIFELPEYHPEWLNGVAQDENGNLVAKPGWPIDLPQKIQAFAKAREAANIKFLQDPMAVLAPAIMPQVQQLADQLFQQRLADYDHRQRLAQFERDNAAWIFMDGKGGQITPAAQMWNQHYSQAKQSGHPDPIGYAQAMVDREVYRSAYEQQLAETQKKEVALTAKQKDREFIKTAAKKQTNRSGAQPNGTTKKSMPRADGKFPANRLLQQLKSLPDEAFDDI